MINDIKADWNLIISDSENKEDIIHENINNMRILISFINSKIPNNEAESGAKLNYLWKKTPNKL